MHVRSLRLHVRSLFQIPSQGGIFSGGSKWLVRLDGHFSSIDERFGDLLQTLENDIDKHKGSFFEEGSDEEKRFYEKIDALIAQHHVKEMPKDWHDQEPKSKLKLAIKVPFFDYVGLEIKHEWEFDTANAKRPKTWAEFKRWFLYPKSHKSVN